MANERKLFGFAIDGIYKTDDGKNENGQREKGHKKPSDDRNNR